MGLFMKAGLLLFALMMLGLGAWMIAIPVAAYLFIPPLVKGRTEKRANGPQGGKGSLGAWLNAAGGVLILLSLAAYSTGGTFSPVVLSATGMAVLFRRRLATLAALRMTPLQDSILLRSRLNPCRWSAVAEVKVSTRDLEGALSGVDERLLLISNPAPRILLVFSTTALGRTVAEEQLTKRIRSTARALLPFGVYLLPLDSGEASAFAQVSSALVKPQGKGAQPLLSTYDFGAAAVEAEHGFVDSLELYSRTDGGLRPRSILTGPRTKLHELVTLREFLHEALPKVGSPHPDRYTTFLSSMAATEGETLGQRITQTESQGGQVLLVVSPGSPQVEVTKAQLRAITRIYS